MKKSTLLKRAFKAAEKSMSDAVKRRDEKCVLCGEYFGLQAHHAIISRKHKSTFFEIRQMVTLCAGCHTSATFKNHGADIRAAAIVAEREGMGYIEWLFITSREIKKWTLTELEELKTKFDLYGLDPDPSVHD